MTSHDIWWLEIITLSNEHIIFLLHPMSQLAWLIEIVLANKQVIYIIPYNLFDKIYGLIYFDKYDIIYKYTFKLDIWVNIFRHHTYVFSPLLTPMRS